jgi:transcriptional regulator with XRE-family HTH domain
MLIDGIIHTHHSLGASLEPEGPVDDPTYTLNAYESQGKKRLADGGRSAYTGAMPDASPAARKLKQLRERARLSIREVAHALGMEHGSSYQHYEDRFRKPHLPLDFVRKLLPIFAGTGVEAAELYALAGVEGSTMRPLGLRGGAAGEADKNMLRIEELDVRASAGAGLIGEQQKIVAEWQLPSGIVRGYSTAPAHELRIITVMGDSMEPSLLPGQRVLVDTGDRMPSPPGIFVVWDGLGLVVKRLQVLPHSEPPRVRISSDNGKYDPYERTLDEAYIQGRVIGQWRWL